MVLEIKRYGETFVLRLKKGDSIIFISYGNFDVTDLGNGNAVVYRDGLFFGTFNNVVVKNFVHNENVR